MKVVVLGTGYVGLVTGVCLASVGHQVTCYDIDEKKIELIRKGIVPIYEPGVETLLNSHTIRFTTTLKEEGFTEAEICIIAVPTPPNPDGSCDLTYILDAAKTIALEMRSYKLIVIKSTVPVGTAKRVQEMVETYSTVPFDIASNPEFLREGAAVSDCLTPDRIIVGVENERAKETMLALYKPFKILQERIFMMDLPSAEITKYAANAMLAARISFMNEMAGLCERVGATIHDVQRGLGADPRIGPHFLSAGVGYGGSCFPKDVQALSAMGRQVGYEMLLMEAIHSVNEMQKRVLFMKLEEYFGEALQGKVVAVWGLAFKPNTDDMREAPALRLIEELLSAGATVKAYDPIAAEKARNLITDERVVWCKDSYSAACGADAIALVTEWQEFKMIDLQRVLEGMRGKAFFDGRNVFRDTTMREKGFHYVGIGVPGLLEKKEREGEGEEEREQKICKTNC